MTAVWPVQALQRGAGGEATIQCRVNFEGALDDCAVISESPPGIGFGDAALRLAPMFEMTKGLGAPDGPRPTVKIPVRWTPTQAMPTLHPGSVLQVTGPRWLSAPTAAQVAAAYPKGGGGMVGYAYLSCHVISRRQHRPLRNTSDEQPPGKGFAEAAQTLSPKFRGSGRRA